MKLRMVCRKINVCNSILYDTLSKLDLAMFSCVISSTQSTLSSISFSSSMLYIMVLIMNELQRCMDMLRVQTCKKSRRKSVLI